MNETPVTTEPTREYIGGGLHRRASVIPWAMDDLTRELGDGIYRQMLNDAQVAATIRAYKAAVLRDGVTLTSAVQDADADGYQLAADLTDLIERQIDDMDSALDDTLWSMLDAIALGCTVAEEVYTLDTSYTGRMQLALRALRPKPRSQVALVTNAFNEIIGVRGRIVAEASVETGAAYEVLDRSKFAIFSFQPPDGDPRGSSLLRPAFNAYDLKCRTWPEYYKYLVQFASPSVVGVAAPGSPTVPDPDDVSRTISAVEALLRSLLDFQNGSALALPNGASADVLWSQGEGQAFLQAFSLFDRQITTAILAQTRATMEAEHGSKADSETGKSIFDTFIQQTRRALARTIRRDVLMDIAVWNYGPSARRLAPIISLGETEADDLTPLMNAVALLERAGYLSPSQLPDLDLQLGLAARTPEEIQQRADRSAAPPPAPALPPGGSPKPTDAPADPTQETL